MHSLRRQRKFARGTYSKPPLHLLLHDISDRAFLILKPFLVHPVGFGLLRPTKAAMSKVNEYRLVTHRPIALYQDITRLDVLTENATVADQADNVDGLFADGLPR